RHRRSSAYSSTITISPSLGRVSFHSAVFVALFFSFFSFRNRQILWFGTEFPSFLKAHRRSRSRLSPNRSFDLEILRRDKAPVGFACGYGVGTADRAASWRLWGSQSLLRLW